MTGNQHVLYVGSTPAGNGERVAALEAAGITVHSVNSELDGLKWLDDRAVDCVVADAAQLEWSIGAFEEWVHDLQPGVDVLVVGDLDPSVSDGPIEYVPADDALATTIDRIVSRNRIESGLSQYRDLRDAVLAISRELPGATSREAIEQIVYAHVSEIDHYWFVRVGDYDADTEMLHFRVPLSGSFPASELPSLVSTPGSEFVDRAIDTGEVTTAREMARMRGAEATAGALDIGEPASSRGATGTPVTSAVVPFVHDESVHGLLLLVATGAGSTGETERALLSDLGRIVGQALDRGGEADTMSPEQFADYVVHELVNPLSIARGHLDTIQNNEDIDGLDRVDHALTQMERILTSEVALFRGRDIDELTLNDLAADASDAWASLRTPDAELVVEASRQFYADHALVTRLLANLFDNAVDAAPDVTVRIGLLDAGFYVEDDGPGIPDGARLWIFDHGFTTGEGSGLGLAIVRRIVEAHGWEIAVRTGNTGGARFEVTGVTFNSR